MSSPTMPPFAIPRHAHSPRWESAQTVTPTAAAMAIAQRHDEPRITTTSPTARTGHT